MGAFIPGTPGHPYCRTVLGTDLVLVSPEPVTPGCFGLVSRDMGEITPCIWDSINEVDDWEYWPVFRAWMFQERLSAGMDLSGLALERTVV